MESTIFPQNTQELCCKGKLYLAQNEKKSYNGSTSSMTGTIYIKFLGGGGKSPRRQGDC